MTRFIALGLLALIVSCGSLNLKKKEPPHRPFRIGIGEFKVSASIRKQSDIKSKKEIIGKDKDKNQISLDLKEISEYSRNYIHEKLSDDKHREPVLIPEDELSMGGKELMEKYQLDGLLIG